MNYLNKYSEVDTVGRGALRSLRLQAETDKTKALTSLKLLLDHPVGIGDHSTEDYHKNLSEALAQLVDADDKLSVIDKYFGI